MNVKLIACTNVVGEDVPSNFDKEAALNFGAKMAGVCYMNGLFEELMNEPKDRTEKRKLQTLASGHHSVYDHFKLTLEFSGIPKILAMILNNEKDYSTSEKSARYTKYDELSEPSKSLYFKWRLKLREIIKNKYSFLYDNTKEGDKAYAKIDRLAQENARYFVSVFEPTTLMAYTVSLRQLNYIIYMLKNYAKFCDESKFNKLLIPFIDTFVSLLYDYVVEDLIPRGKNRRISLFGDKKYESIPDFFSYAYQTSFYSTFACEAQNQRHRSESNFIYIPDNFNFYVPEILENKNDIDEWLTDAKLVDGTYPQGQIIKVVQTGSLDTLALKATERICGSAQLEIMRHTAEIITKFTEQSEYADMLIEKTHNATAKCLFSGAYCASPCVWGKNQFGRKI